MKKLLFIISSIFLLIACDDDAIDPTIPQSPKDESTTLVLANPVAYLFDVADATKSVTFLSNSFVNRYEFKRHFSHR